MTGEHSRNLENAESRSSPRPSAAPNPEFDALPTNPHGEAMLRELKNIHAMLRENLAIVRELALAAIGGTPAGEVRQAVRELTDRHGLAALQVNCLYYCRFVHGHHGLEDAAMFPLVRLANAGVDLVVDRLESDHRLVGDLLHAVESAAERLTDAVGSAEPDAASSALCDTDLAASDLAESGLAESGPAGTGEADAGGAGARSRVRDALTALEQHLLEHLAYEEDALAPTMRRMTGW